MFAKEKSLESNVLQKLPYDMFTYNKIEFSTVIDIFQNKFYFLKNKTVFTGKGLKC